VGNADVRIVGEVFAATTVADSPDPAPALFCVRPDGMHVIGGGNEGEQQD